MKKFLYGLAALSLAAGFAACDDTTDPNNPDEVCTSDSTCGGFICDIADGEDEGECLQDCLSNDDCAEGYVCDETGSGLCLAEGGTDPGETAAEYDRVLVISRTTHDKDQGDCRSPNPGPDMDTILYKQNGGATTDVVVEEAQHGEYCGSEEVTDWAAKEVLELQTSLQGDGTCDTDNAVEKYYFMGTGQPQADGETIAANTGYIVVSFEKDGEPVNIENDGEITVIEINQFGNDGTEMCSNLTVDRQGDDYDVYLVKKGATVAGTPIKEPDFIRITNGSAVGLYTHLVTEVPEGDDGGDGGNGGVID